MRRFVAKAEKGKGWRVWDNLLKRTKYQAFSECPHALLSALNDKVGGDKLTKLFNQTPKIK
jgi:hypothetical protein